MKNLILLSGTAIAALALSAFSADGNQSCSKSATTASWTGSKDIVDTAVAAGSFKTLAAALQAADLVDTLKGDGPFTVFAPTDDAFAALPEGTVESLLKPENRGALANVLTFHVVPGRVSAAQVVELTGATAVNGQRLPISASDAGVTVAGAKVVKTDIECANGIIHVIDSVMLPSSNDIIDTAVGAGSFKTLAAALKAAGLVEALKSEGPFTVFAPTDEAFAALPEGTVETLLEPENRDKLTAILKYHVVAGRVYSDQLSEGDVKTLAGNSIRVSLANGVKINSSRVTAADLDTTNGVIHVIDTVLLPE